MQSLMTGGGGETVPLRQGGGGAVRLRRGEGVAVAYDGGGGRPRPHGYNCDQEGAQALRE